MIIEFENKKEKLSKREQKKKKKKEFEECEWVEWSGGGSCSCWLLFVGCWLWWWWWCGTLKVNNKKEWQIISKSSVMVYN